MNMLDTKKKSGTPWSFTIEFDEEKAKRNGYDVETLYEYVGKNIEQIGNVRISRDTWKADDHAKDKVIAQCAAQARLSKMKWFMQNIKSWIVYESDPSIPYDHLQTIREISPQLICN